MFLLYEKVWVIISYYDIPKPAVIIDYQVLSNDRHSYKIQYKDQTQWVRNEYIYSSQSDAEIHWAIMMQEELEIVKNNLDIFGSVDACYQANKKAKKLLKKYIENHPDLLLKTI